jgi:hypothetical protein
MARSCAEHLAQIRENHSRQLVLEFGAGVFFAIWSHEVSSSRHKTLAG